MKMLELHFLTCVLEAEKAELLDLFFIESFFMRIEGTLRCKVFLWDFIIVHGHFSSLLLEIGGHHGPSTTVSFLIAEDLYHGVVVMRMHPVDARFGSGTVFKQVKAIFAWVVLAATQSNIRRRGEFRFGIVNEILSVTSIAALFEVLTAK